MRLTVTVPDPVAEAARELARERDSSVSAVVAEAVAEYVRSERRRRAAARIESVIGHADVAPDALEDLRALRKESDRSID